MDKKMKIAFLSFYSGEVYRGVETYTHELANRLVDLGIDVTVCQNGPLLKDSKYKTISTGMEINWHKKNGEDKVFGIFFTDYYARLIGRFTNKVLKQLDKDTDIIITSNGSLQVLILRVWSLMHGVKMITVGHSGIGADDKLNLLSFPDRFVVFTDFYKKWAHGFNFLVKIAKIPNGVDIKKFRSNQKAVKVDLPHPIILSVGALIKQKRLDLLVKAVGKLKNVSLLIVGSGDAEKELFQEGTKLLGKRFKIMSLPFDQISNIYPAADLFTYPTVPFESFGIVLVEAMASGLPVVATDDPIRREIVGNAGYFVDPTDTLKYAETLELALKTKWDSKPRQQAEKFNWDEVAIKYKNLFEELVK